VYIPEAFRETRTERLHAFMRQHSFALVVSHRGDRLEASHLPLLLEADRGPCGTLVGHMARANLQWRSFEADSELLVIFSGPHAYISPSWYENHPSVPTWNYAAVHAYGIPRLVENPAALRPILEALVRTHEADRDNPWTMDLPDDYLERMVKAIVGFEIEITRLEGKLKLGQNRTQGDPASVEVAALMQQALPSDAGIPDPFPPAHHCRLSPDNSQQ
jgi:transcriptional regulator